MTYSATKKLISVVLGALLLLGAVSCQKENAVAPYDMHPAHEHGYLKVGIGWYHVVDAAFAQYTTGMLERYTFFSENGVTVDVVMQQGAKRDVDQTNFLSAYVSYGNGGYEMLQSGKFVHQLDTTGILSCQLNGVLANGDSIRLYYNNELSDARKPVGEGFATYNNLLYQLDLAWVEKVSYGYRYTFTSPGKTEKILLKSAKILKIGDYNISSHEIDTTSHDVNVILSGFEGMQEFGYVEGRLSVMSDGKGYVWLNITGSTAELHHDVVIQYNGDVWNYGKID